MIDSQTLHFLEDLAKNNEKEWFHNHKQRYEEARENFTEFSAGVLEKLKTIQEDLLHTDVKKCILRINRDVRFSKDKTPYKIYFGAGFGPGGKSSGRADFYFQLEPGGKSFLGGGMWAPSPENLSKWRQEIDYNPSALKNIIYSKEFSRYFTENSGVQLKTKPKDYEADHPEIDLLRYKELFFYRNYCDETVCSKEFENEIFKGCQILKPYLDYVNGLFFDDF